MKFKIGDSVSYSPEWLRSISCYTGDLPFARGVIESFVPLGESTLAVINWNDPEIPPKVNVKNLTKMRRMI